MKDRAAAIGMFDGVHLGHQALVQCVVRNAQERGQEPTIFTFFEHPLSLIAPDKAPLVLTPHQEKADLLLKAGASMVVILRFDEELRQLSAKQFMQKLCDEYCVRTLVLGFNHRFGHDGITDFASYQAIGAEVGMDVVLCTDEVATPQGEPVSSSAIRQHLLCGDIATATAMLGRPYSIYGTVGHGLSIGHRIGFPTANLVPADSRQLIPDSGVYACRVRMEDGTAYPAMTNIGSRPTITGGNGARTIEAHIIGFDRDIYGQSLTLQFTALLRREQKFAGLDELKAQLELDRKAALSALG